MWCPKRLESCWQKTKMMNSFPLASRIDGECVDYKKLNLSTCNPHFALPFMDQMVERLAGKSFYCFLDGYSGYN